MWISHLQVGIIFPWRTVYICQNFMMRDRHATLCQFTWHTIEHLLSSEFRTNYTILRRHVHINRGDLLIEQQRINLNASSNSVSLLYLMAILSTEAQATGPLAQAKFDDFAPVLIKSD